MSNQPVYVEPPRRKGMPVLKILGFMLLVVVLICGGMVTYVAYNFRSWAAGFARGPMVSMVDSSALPADQKELIKHNVTRVADAFQQGKLSFSQFSSILEKLSQGPAAGHIIVEGVRAEYAAAHPTLDDARRETMLLLDRAQRGLAEGKISLARIQQAMNGLPDTNQTKQALTEGDLKPFLDSIRQAVEQAGIPVEAFQVDFAAEIDKAVAAVMGPSALQPASQAESETVPTTRPE